MRKNWYIYVFLLLTLAYGVLTVLAPSDPEALKKYHITQTSAHLFALSIVIPLFAIYFCALYGMVRIKNYADHIRDTKEGPGMAKMSVGVMALAFSLPISSLVGTIFTYITVKNPHALAATTIIRNYCNLILPAIGFLLLAQGTGLLVKQLKKYSPNSLGRLGLLGIIVLSSVYTWLITTRPFSEAGDTAYYLPSFIILATLAVPYMYVWCRGLVSVYQLYVYKKHVRGSIYKKALGYLSVGIAWVVIVSILSQMLLTLSGWLQTLNFAPLLIFIYVFVAVIAVGYVLIARGAKKLKQIEEV